LELLIFIQLIMKHLTAYINLFLLLLLASPLKADNNSTFNTDSLILLLAESPDSAKIKIYKDLCWQYRNINPHQAIEFGNRAKLLIEATRQYAELPALLNIIGVVKRNQNLVGEAFSYFKAAHRSAYYFDNETEIAYSCNNIADILTRVNQNEMALKYVFDALIIFYKKNDNNGIAYCFTQAARIFLQQKQYNKVRIACQNAIFFRKKFDDQKGISSIYNILAESYWAENDKDLAFSFFKKAYDIRVELNDEAGIAESKIYFGKYFAAISNVSTSIQHYKEALTLTQKLGSQQYLLKIYIALTDLYKTQLDFETALNYMEKYNDLRDSLILIEENLKVEDLKKYGVMNESAQIDNLLNNLNVDYRIETERTKQYNIFILWGISVLLSFAVFLGWVINRKLKDNRRLEHQNKEIRQQEFENLTQRDMLQQQKTQLEELNLSKDKFFSIIAHDLKNPFNALIGFTDMLITEFDELDNNEKIELLHLTNKASQDTFELLENLLQWSRKQTGSLKFQPEIVDIYTIVQKTVNLLQGNASQKKIFLISEVKQNSIAFCDAQMINTVIRNLITNAIKFTTEGGSVTISCEFLASINKLQIEVKDTGVGMTENDMKKLFKIDVKLTTTGTNNETGTGLGLILCKEFVEVNGGRIFVESIMNEGSTFKFTLPVAGE